MGVLKEIDRCIQQLDESDLSQFRREFAHWITRLEVAEHSPTTDNPRRHAIPEPACRSSLTSRPSHNTYAESPTTSKPRQTIEAVVVGTMYQRRQDSIMWMWLGERVWLKREPDNSYDRNAVAVLRQSGRCIGYLGRQLALDLAPGLDRYGLPVVAVVTLLTGSYPQRGVRIRFAVPRDG
jgi:hypothetical protein